MSSSPLPIVNSVLSFPWLLRRYRVLPAHVQRQMQFCLSRLSRWHWAGVGLGLVGLWHWQLVLAVAIGLAAAVGAYLLQQGQRLHIDWVALWNAPSRSVVLSLGCGGVALLGSYTLLTAAINWMQIGWLAVIVLQAGGLAILLQRQSQPSVPTAKRGHASIDRWLAALSDPQPLQRLIAVRQLTALWTSQTPHREVVMQPAHLADCFRLMLHQETDPLIRSALLDGLQTLSRDRVAPTALPAARMPSVSPRPLTARQRIAQSQTD